MAGECFVIGYPVAHSLSPVMFTAAFREVGLPWSYRAIAVPPGRTPEVLARLAARGVVGVNVTMPLKQEVLSQARIITPRARLAGAGNTLTLVGDAWEADNTDWPGLRQAIAEVADVDELVGSGGPALVLGAGGAAAACAFCLAEMGLPVVIVNRDAGRGELLAARVGGQYLGRQDPSLQEVLAGAAVVVNATPLGMTGQDGASPLPPGLRVPAGCVACDLVYRPVETEFLRQARANGARVVDGLAVLLWQGALAFQRWTGQPAPVETMRRALRGAVGGEGR